MILFQCFFPILFLSKIICCKNSISQDYSIILNSDLNTLKHVQIVHTHGDRTPSKFVQNDPFSIVPHFWPEGIGQLTYLGKFYHSDQNSFDF